MMGFLNRFVRQDEQGSVFLIMAFAMLGVVGSVGVAVDLARSQMVQAKLQSSVDAAGLVVGSRLNSSDVNALATKYVQLNFSSGTLGTQLGTVTTEITADNAIVTLTANASVPTTFMNIFGKTSVPISATSEVTRAQKGMELVLVLDNTGSMSNPVNPSNSNTTKLAALKSALVGTGGMLDILYGAGKNKVDNLWVGVVPFSQAVNVGTANAAWVNSESYDWGKPTAQTWQGCVTSRATPYDSSDDPPSVAMFDKYYAPSTSTLGSSPSGTGVSGNCPNGGTSGINNWKCTVATKSGGNTKNVLTYDFSTYNDKKGPNALCVTQKVLPMVAEKATVVANVNGMTAAGSTFINTGMAWGQRMLSPRWRGLWGGQMNTNQLPLDYNTKLMNKVVVLMTDGMNQFSNGNYTNYGFLADNKLGTTTSRSSNNYAGTAEDKLEQRTLAICNAMKANGVIIYTIGFGKDDNNNFSSSTSVNGALLKACATSSSYYFLAPTNADLQEAFHQIGDSLANLRISH